MWFIGRIWPSQGYEVGSTPIICSRKSAATHSYFFINDGSRKGAYRSFVLDWSQHETREKCPVDTFATRPERGPHHLLQKECGYALLFFHKRWESKRSVPKFCVGLEPTRNEGKVSCGHFCDAARKGTASSAPKRVRLRTLIFS